MAILNVSRLDEFATCEQKMMYRFEPSPGFPHGMEPWDDEETSAMGFGTAIHEALRAFYVGVRVESAGASASTTQEDGGDGEGGRLRVGADEDPFDGVEPGTSAGLAPLAAAPVVPVVGRSVIERAKDALAAYRAVIGDHLLAAFGERLLGHYFDRYAVQDSEWEVLAVEEEWACDIGEYHEYGPMPPNAPVSSAVGKPFTVGFRHRLVGRWDLVVRAPIGGEGGTLWHVQHKTTGASSLDLYCRQYDLAWHERAYSMAIRERWPSERVGGTILNLVRRPRLGTKKVDPDMDFKRYFVPVDTESIARFVRDAVQRADRIEERRRTQAWEQNPRSCTMYSRVCPFHALCLGMPVETEAVYGVREPDYVDLMVEKARQAR